MSRDMTKPTKWLSGQRSLRSAWASAQSDQSLRCPHEERLGPWLPIKHTSKTSLLAHTSSESKGTFRQKARPLAPLNGWACAVKICHDGMLEDTNSLDGAHLISKFRWGYKMCETSRCTGVLVEYTVMILNFRTDMPRQLVQPQIRLLLLLKEQSDQGLQCLPFRLHRLDSLLYGRATSFKFLSDYKNVFGCPNI